jgi:hypothetical protein
MLWNVLTRRAAARPRSARRVVDPALPPPAPARQSTLLRACLGTLERRRAVGGGILGIIVRQRCAMKIRQAQDDVGVFRADPECVCASIGKVTMSSGTHNAEAEERSILGLSKFLQNTK